MKKIILFFFGFAMLTVATSFMTSCLQYDEPGDEFEMGQLKPDTAGKAKSAPAFESVYNSQHQQP